MVKLRELTVCGGAYQRGYQHGSVLQQDIVEFLEHECAHINLFRKEEKFKWPQLLNIVQSYIPLIEQYLPLVAEEIRGLAEGARISYEKAMLLQLRRELISHANECSAIGYTDQKGRVVIAQNVDLPGRVKRYGLILRSYCDDGTQILQYTLAGLIGFAGMNNHGIVLAINMVLSGKWRVGIPAYLLARHLLQQRSLQQCILAINKIPRASSRSFLLGNSTHLLNVEMTVDDYRIIRNKILLHTNHYLHPDLQRIDMIDTSACTFPRMKILNEFVSTEEKITVDKLKILFKNHHNFPKSICAHAKEAKDPETVSSLIFLSKPQYLLAAYGNPCINPYYYFPIKV